MVTSIMHMLGDTVQWLATFFAAVGVFAAAMWILLSDEEGSSNSEWWVLIRYFINLGLKVSPLTGAKPLIANDDQDVFVFLLIQFFWLVTSTMLYSLLVAIFSTRMTNNAKTRIPHFHRAFCKLVLAEHTKPPAPSPLQAIGLPAILIERWIFGRIPPDMIQRTEFSQSYEQLKSTPEKQWHSIEYTRENPPSTLLQKMLAKVEKDMLKREGALTASTGKDLIGTNLQANLRDLATLLEARIDAKLEVLTDHLHPSGSGPREGDAPDPPQPQKARVGETGKAVKVYAGFVERADRLIFPYGEYREHFKDPDRKVYHMTILRNGVVENPKKRLYLGGNFTEKDREDLCCQTGDALRDMLDKRKGKEVVEKCSTNEDLINALMGTERETDLDQRALCAFPFQQSMEDKVAGQHRLVDPNNKFVRDNRSDGTYGLSHCWPVKYNAKWKEQFKTTDKNPNKSYFSPRMAAEYRECMALLFGELSKPCKVLYCTKTTVNETKALVGTAEQLIDFLRVRPKLQEELKIIKLFPDGFTTRVTVKGRADTEKQFRMQSDGQAQVVYMKFGHETMGCCKPLTLFYKDCEFRGKPVEVSEEHFKPPTRTRISEVSKAGAFFQRPGPFSGAMSA